jgi:hypothetical protein
LTSVGRLLERLLEQVLKKKLSFPGDTEFIWSEIWSNRTNPRFSEDYRSPLTIVLLCIYIYIRISSLPEDTFFCLHQPTQEFAQIPVNKISRVKYLKHRIKEELIIPYQLSWKGG